MGASVAQRVAGAGQRKHPEIKRLGCPSGATYLRGHGARVRADRIGEGIDDQAWRFSDRPNGAAGHSGLFEGFVAVA